MKYPRPNWNVNPPHKYGVMTPGEAALMDEICLRVKEEFGGMRFLEIGVAGGSTMAGVMERCEEIGCPMISYSGVDGEAGKPCFMPPFAKFYQGDSAEMWLEIKDEFNFLFVDACHCVNHVMMDFLHYSTMVVVNGYCLFHDTRDTDWQGKHYQGHGPHAPPFQIGVRQALLKLGLLNELRSDWRFVQESKDSDIMGMMLYKKVKPL